MPFLGVGALLFSKPWEVNIFGERINISDGPPHEVVKIVLETDDAETFKAQSKAVKAAVDLAMENKPWQMDVDMLEMIIGHSGFARFDPDSVVRHLKILSPASFLATVDNPIIETVCRDLAGLESVGEIDRTAKAATKHARPDRRR